MTASDLVAALRPVAQALDALGVRYYIGGSVASSAHGIARASLDTDVVAMLEPEHVDGVVNRLDSAYIPVDRLRTAAASKSSCNFIHLATMFKIDLFVSKGRPFDRRAMERARRQPLDEGPDPFTSRSRPPRTRCWRSSSGFVWTAKSRSVSGGTSSES